MLKNYALFVIVAGFFLLSLGTAGRVAAGIPMDTAQLRALDKVTGRTSTVEVKVGEVAEFGTLLIKVDVCKTNPPEETPENAAFLEIVNIPRKTNKGIKIFGGWMFSSSPALSALENPNYDVWVLKCIGNVLAEQNKKEGEDADAHHDKDVMPTVIIEDETVKEHELETETDAESDSESEVAPAPASDSETEVKTLVAPPVPDEEVSEDSFWFKF